MAIDLKEYAELKARAEEDRRRADKASGGLEQVKQTIKTEFGCDTIKKARELLAKMQKEYAELEEKYRKQLAEIKSQFGNKIEGR